MLSVLLIWIYITLTAAVSGGIFCGLLLKKESFQKLHFEDLSICGLMLVTVYAQIFSLFAGVGLVANILLLCICLVLCVVFRRKISVTEIIKKVPRKPLLFFCVLIAVLLMAYGSSAGYFHYDSDLYHGQSVRWIEEFGVVKGLVNLHTRLAYNSSSFAMTALYSFSWLGGKSYHVCAGYLALLVLFECLRAIPRIVRRKMRVSDFVRLGGIYYILNIYDDMVSPASDYFTMLLLFFVVIRIIDFFEAGESDADLYAIPALLAIFLATVKFSAAMIVLVCLVPIVILIKDKRFARLGVYVVLGLLVAAPFFVRGVLLSGYLLYPSTLFDVFGVDWKLPKELAEIDSSYIIAFGRGYTSFADAGRPLGEWFPHWMSGLGRVEKLLFLASVFGMVWFIVSLFVRKGQKILHCVEFALIVTFLSWFFSAPLIRYGQGILICLAALIAGDLILLILKKCPSFAGTVVAVLIAVFLLYKGLMLAKYIATTSFWNSYALNQQDYGTYQLRPVDIDGLTVYVPTDGDRTGYEPFPATPEINSNLGLRGDSVRDGFRLK